VQSIRWHSAEATLLLCGSTDGGVRLADCRDADAVAAKWQFANAEVEQLLWDRFTPFNFLVATNDGLSQCLSTEKHFSFPGQLSCCDSRKPNFVLHSTSVFIGDEEEEEKSTASIAFDQNHLVKTMFATSGEEVSPY
jgi:hypothetical protein